jgi:hypothetical protein
MLRLELVPGKSSAWRCLISTASFFAINFGTLFGTLFIA